MSKINLSEMHDSSKFTVVCEANRDSYIREAVRNIETAPSDSRGMAFTYVTSGDCLVFVCRDKFGYVNVYETKINRAATISPEGKQF